MRQPPAIVWASLALGWALLVWWLLETSVVPGVSLVTAMVPAILQPWQDKIAHVTLFFVQTLLIERAAAPRLGWRRALLVAVAFSVFYGAVTELRQRSVPGRDADPADVAADAFGATSYAAVLYFTRRPGRARASR